MTSVPRSKASASLSQPGVPAATGKQTAWEKLYQRGLVVAAKQQLAHEELAEQSNNELEQCTFHPSINQTSRSLTTATKGQGPDDLFAKLFEDAACLRRRREEKAAAQRQRAAAEALRERNKLRELNLANQRSIAGGGQDIAGADDASPVFDRLARKRGNTSSSMKLAAEAAGNACTFKPNVATQRSASQQRKMDALCSAARRRQQLDEEAKAQQAQQQQQQQQRGRRSAQGSREASQDAAAGGSRPGSGRLRAPSPTVQLAIRQAQPAAAAALSASSPVPRHARPTESFSQMKRDNGAAHADPALLLPADEPLTLAQLHQHNLRNAARSDLPQPTKPDWFA